MNNSLLRPTVAGIYAAITILIGAVFTGIIIAGFFFGMAVAAVGALLGLFVTINSGRELSQRIRTPGRDELIAVLAGLAVIAATIPVAVFSETYAWIGIPIGGGAAIWMVYAYSHPDYGVRKQERKGGGPVMTSPADLHVGLVDTFRRVDVFEDLAEDDLRRLAELGDVRSVPSGQMLGAEGKQAQAVYVVLDGRANVSAFTSEGRKTIGAAEPGDPVPMDALVGDGTLHATVKAETDMKVWGVDREVLDEHFRQHTEVGERVGKRAEMIVAGRRTGGAPGS